MHKKILSMALSVSMVLSSAVAVYAKPDRTTYITGGNMDFEKYSVSADTTALNNELKAFNTNAVVASANDYTAGNNNGDKILKIYPSGTNAMKVGIINWGQWTHKFYSQLGAKEDKLIQFKLNFLLPSVLLEEEAVQSTGIIIMPAQGSFAFNPAIYEGLKYKAVDDKFVLADGSNVVCTEVAADEWHEVHVIYSFKEQTFRYYLDGTQYICDKKATAPIVFSDNGDVDHYMASGMYIKTPGSLSSDAYILADNLEIYQSDKKFTMSADYDSDSEKAFVEFSNDITEDMLGNLSVCDDDENDIGAEFDFVNSKKAEIIFPQNYLKYGKNYSFDVVANADFTDNTLQYIMPTERSVDLSFKTPKDKSKVYIEDTKCDLTYNGTSLEESDSVTYNAVIGNGTGSVQNIIAGVVLYGENEKLIDFKLKQIALKNTENTDSFEFSALPAGVKYARLYLWNDNEDKDGIVSGLLAEPEATPSKTLDVSSVYATEALPEFDVRVTDSLNNELTVSGLTGENSDEKLVTVAMIKGTADSLTAESDAFAIGYANVDNGKFSYKFTLNVNSGIYTALVITDNGTYTKEFEYMPLSELADFVKDVKNGTVAEEDICDETKALNNGFGIDFDNYFKTEKEIKLFNEFMASNVSKFKGPEDSDYVTQFMTVVNELIARVDYLRAVNAADSEAKMLKLLQDGVKYTSISFTAYNALTAGQKNLALAKMTETEFDAMEDIKPAFERFTSAASGVTYLSKGYASFDGVANGAVSNNGGSFEMKFNSGSVMVVDDEVAKLKGDTNKAIKVSPSAAGSKFYFGLICTGQWNDMLYTKMGLDSSKLLMFGLDVYFPSQMLTEEYMTSTGLTLMPGSGNFVNDNWILTDSVFKKVNSSDDYLTFVNGQKLLKKIETDKWHKINVVYDFDSKTIRYYIDGEMLLKDYDVATALDLNDMGCGIRYVCPANVSEDFTIYFDNVEIYQANEAFGLSAEYDRDNDDVVVSLTSPIDNSALSEISVEVDGKTLTNPDLSNDGKTVSYNLTALNLKNDKEYSAKIKVSEMLSDGLNQYITESKREVECKFTTTRSKEMYITDNSAFSGSNYNVEVRNLSSAKDALVAVAEYDANEKLVNVWYKTQNMVYGVNSPVEFENVDSTKQIKSFLWTDNWSLKHNPIVVNAQDELEAPIKSDAVVPDFSVVTTDAGNEVLTVSGKYSGEADSFVTVIVSDDTIENYQTSTIALEATRTDKDGLFGVSFKMGKPSGTYNAYVIINETVYKKEFTYSSLSDTSGVVKRIANGEIAQDDVYSSVIVYNSGFGIDTAYFTEQPGKDTFNKRVMQNKATLVGPENTDYVSQFMNIVKSIIAELDYTKALEDVPYSGSIKAKLDEGISYTNIDFTAYNALTSYQQSLVQEDMLKAVFTDGDDIKSKFDSFVNNAKGKIPPTTGGGTSGSVGGTSVIPSAFNGSNSNNNNNDANKDLFNDLSKSHWAAAAIARLVNKNIVSGTGNGNYEPDLNVKREQFVKMGVLGAGLETINEKSEFTDVPDGSWYLEYVMAAKRNNIISGMADGSFGTGANITREDMAVIVYNILKQNGVEMEEIADNSLSDFESISDYAKEAVKQLYAKKIINGMGDGSFAPKSYATRAQAATIIDAMMTELGK